MPKPAPNRNPVGICSATPSAVPFGSHGALSRLVACSTASFCVKCTT